MYIYTSTAHTDRELSDTEATAKCSTYKTTVSDQISTTCSDARMI